MKTYADCVPCFLRQALEAARMATPDEKVHDRILKRVLQETAKFSFHLTPPHMGQIIHRIVRQESGNPDPYLREKRRLNRLALQIYPQLRREVSESRDPRDMALRLATAGNLTDYGPPGLGAKAKMETVVGEARRGKWGIDHHEAFWRAVEAAKDILYLGDNAGEVVFDRILLEYLPAEKVTFAVRGGPTINDVTRDDMKAVGLDGRVALIDNGSDAPGTILEDCSPQFREHFEKADLVISKGQGNYETLNDLPGHIVHLLKVKCPVVARDLSVPEGSLIVRAMDLF